MSDNDNTEEKAAASNESADDEKTSENNQSEDKTSEENDGEGGNELLTANAQKKHFKSKYESVLKEKLALEEASKKLNDDKLKEQEKYKELYEQEKKSHESVRTLNKDMAIRSEFTSEISKNSPLDIESALKLADLSEVTINEDGEVIGMSKVVERLVEDKSFLFDTGKKAVNPGASAQADVSAQEGGGPNIYTATQVAEMRANKNNADGTKKTLEQLRAQQQEILLARAEGRIKG